MLLLLAGVARLFPYSYASYFLKCFTVMVLLSTQLVFSQDNSDTQEPQSPSSGGYLARIFNDSPEEVAAALERS